MINDDDARRRNAELCTIAYNRSAPGRALDYKHHGPLMIPYAMLHAGEAKMIKEELHALIDKLPEENLSRTSRVVLLKEGTRREVADVARRQEKVSLVASISPPGEGGGVIVAFHVPAELPTMAKARVNRETVVSYLRRRLREAEERADVAHERAADDGLPSDRRQKGEEDAVAALAEADVWRAALACI